MYPTVEVRWFLEGGAPRRRAALVRSRSRHAAAGGAHRPLRPADVARRARGEVARGGKLEVKRLAEALGEARFHERVAGCVERWRKWSFPLAEATKLTHPAGDWIDIAKERRVRYFAAEPDTPLRPLADGEQAARGCGLELGEVRVGEARVVERLPRSVRAGRGRARRPAAPRGRPCVRRRLAGSPGRGCTKLPGVAPTPRVRRKPRPLLPAKPYCTSGLVVNVPTSSA